MITEYDEPSGFSDISIKGPYSFWHHRHVFEDTPEGTVMHDEVTYALPFGILGRLVHGLWVRRQLKNIFDYRAEIINEVFDDNKPGEADEK